MIEWLSLKRQEITNIAEDVEKSEPLCTIVGNVNWRSFCRNGMVVPQKIKLPYDPAVPLASMCAKKRRQTLEHIFARPCSQEQRDRNNPNVNSWVNR